MAEAYGVSKTPESYAYKFLLAMREKANHVITSYAEEFQTTGEEAAPMLNTYRPHRTLTKLLDEYNWIQYTFGE